MRGIRAVGGVLATAVVAFVPATAVFARGTDPGRPGAPLANYDVRDNAALSRSTTTSSARSSGPQASRASTAARDQLSDDLGDQAVLQTDPVNGTLRTIQRLDGALTGAGSGSAQDRAWDYVRDNATAIGLSD